MSVKRGRGRPSKKSEVLSREQVLDAAEALLEANPKGFSLRRLGGELGVDPMAIYTYFQSKIDLERALVLRAFERLHRPPDNTTDWRAEVERLVHSYLTLLLEKPALLSTTLRLGAEARGPAAIFRQRFADAVAPLNLTQPKLDNALELIVDYCHGFVFADQLSESGRAPQGRLRSVVGFYLDSLARISRP